MAKAEKVATVAEITERFRTANAAVITEYRGLTMAQLTELRRSLGSDTAYTIAKNTLVKRAAADAGVQGLDDLLVGRPLQVAEVTRLADLDSREVLLGKLAGAMKGTRTKAAIVLNALPTKTAQLVAALQEKKAAGSDAAGASDLGVTESVEAAADTSEETASA